MEFNGLPLHPLVLHAAVFLDPLSALLAGLYVVPRWRWALRWPMAVAAVFGAAVTWFTSATGSSLKEQLLSHNAGSPSLIATHEMWAGRLQASMWVLAVVAVLAWWALPVVTRLRDAVDRPARLAFLPRVLVALLPIAGIAVIVLCYMTGDAGAKAVWAG